MYKYFCAKAYKDKITLHKHSVNILVQKRLFVNLREPCQNIGQKSDNGPCCVVATSQHCCLCAYCIV